MWDFKERENYIWFQCEQLHSRSFFDRFYLLLFIYLQAKDTYQSSLVRVACKQHKLKTLTESSLSLLAMSTVFWINKLYSWRANNYSVILCLRILLTSWTLDSGQQLYLCFFISHIFMATACLHLGMMGKGMARMVWYNFVILVCYQSAHLLLARHLCCGTALSKHTPLWSWCK